MLERVSNSWLPDVSHSDHERYTVYCVIIVIFIADFEEKYISIWSCPLHPHACLHIGLDNIQRKSVQFISNFYWAFPHVVFD